MVYREVQSGVKTYLSHFVFDLFKWFYMPLETWKFGPIYFYRILFKEHVRRIQARTVFPFISTKRDVIYFYNSIEIYLSF